MTEPPRCTAIVLAGSRDPGADPVARAAGVPIKALAPVGGAPMLARVLDTLAATGTIGRIAVVIDPETLRLPPPALSELLQRPGVSTLPAAGSPSASVVAALDRLGNDVFPCLVTTADHALLTPAMVQRFLEDLDPAADAGVALVTARTIEQRYPHAVRTFYRLGSERYSGCNLFLLRREAARRLPLFWRELERHRKRPWRLIAAIGIAPFVKFLLGRLDLGGAMSELTRLTGARAAAVVLPYPEAAIDVDKPGDLVLAEQILRQRG